MRTKIFATTLLTLTLTVPVMSSADLPDPGMEVVKGRTALVVTDPQNDFLSPDGVTCVSGLKYSVVIYKYDVVIFG